MMGFYLFFAEKENFLPEMVLQFLQSEFWLPEKALHGLQNGISSTKQALHGLQNGISFTKQVLHGLQNGISFTKQALHGLQNEIWSTKSHFTQNRKSSRASGWYSYFLSLYRRDALLGKQLQAEVFQFEFLYFAAARHRECIDKEDVLRDFVAGDFSAAEVFHYVVGHRRALLQDDERADLFAIFLRRHAGYLHIFHARQVVKELFQFARVDVLATPDNHVFDATRDAVIALLVFHAQVAAMQEAVLVDNLGGRFRILVITLHDEVTFATHFTLFAHSAFFARFGIQHLDFRERIFLADRSATLFEGVFDDRVRHAWRTFSQAIDTGDVRNVHLLRYRAHQFNWAKRAGHDAGTERSEVEHREHRMIQLGDEHGRDAIQSRASFLMDRRQDDERIELFDHDLRCAMCQDGHRSQYHAEAMEKRDAAAEFVLRRIVHAFAREVTVVRDVAMCEHDAFREAGSPGRILHVYDIVHRNFRFGLVELLVADVLAQQQEFRRIVHATILFLPDIDHVPHFREACTTEVTTL